MRLGLGVIRRLDASTTRDLGAGRWSEKEVCGCACCERSVCFARRHMRCVALRCIALHFQVF